MSSEKDRLAELIQQLQTQRDELALQVKLGKAEAKEEWEKLNKQLNELTDQYQPIKEAVQETASNVIASLQLTANELKDGFKRIKDSL